MNIKTFFQGKKNIDVDTLPEVAITAPRKAIERLEEHSTSEILSRREEILAGASTSSKTESEILKIDKEPIPVMVNEKFPNRPLILEENESYTRDGLDLSEDEVITSSQRFESTNHLIRWDEPNQILQTLNYSIQSEQPQYLLEDPPEVVYEETLLEPETDFDPYDECASETGYTEVEVTLLDGKQLTYLFNIAKTKFEQQWLDEIHSVGTFTAKDIYGNLVTLSPKVTTHTIVFKITEGNLPGQNINTLFT
ncbi:hypothetical protein ACQKNX_22980 [Lysinibacillus sp. NPDC093712]|uniref:hypothetical protein n=1 Tax=Lysinibacillus sp. NPDC093712 TaxID=3390579 RepID=UPI003D039B88